MPWVSDFDIFLADCPARTTLALIGDSWSVVVLVGLGEQPRRFTALRDRIGGISHKVLTDTLRKLEQNGLVQRRELAARAVEYTLTPLGETLLGPVTLLSRWAEDHTGAVLEAQGTAR